MLPSFDHYIVSVYQEDGYENVNVFTNFVCAEDFILSHTAPYDFRIECLTYGKPRFFITYECES